MHPLPGRPGKMNETFPGIRRREKPAGMRECREEGIRRRGNRCTPEGRHRIPACRSPDFCEYD